MSRPVRFSSKKLVYRIVVNWFFGPPWSVRVVHKPFMVTETGPFVGVQKTQLRYHQLQQNEVIIPSLFLEFFREFGSFFPKRLISGGGASGGAGGYCQDEAIKPAAPLFLSILACVNWTMIEFGMHLWLGKKFDQHKIHKLWVEVDFW